MKFYFLVILFFDKLKHNIEPDIHIILLIKV